MQKIGITGVHSAGKTSLAYILSAYFKMKGCNVKLLHESVRENCPFPINSEANQGTCLWNFHTQFLNELDAEAQGYQLAICDRSVLDTFVYFHAVNPENPITRAAVQQASEWLTTYDVLICLEPVDHVGLHDDGIRSTDRDYQRLITEGFDKALALYGKEVADRTIKASSEDVFDANRRSKLIAQVESKMETAVL
ncbi:MAG: hypothetical protein K940chlam7_00716 [Chlamydiae bacterium]|nr:hypothetical protein [Chlamydiota bacterium]